MSIRQVPLAPREFFHLYNRGTDKRQIFFDSEDYRRFIELLYLCNSHKPISVRDVRKVHDSVFQFERDSTLVAIGAYCLMPNHFHLLVTTEIENGISDFMRKLSTAYSMYFNVRYERTGALFQGRFKTQHADTDEYLKYLYAYIHLNPVKLIDKDWKEKGSRDAAKYLEYTTSYSYSSLPDYLGKIREEGKILDSAKFPEYFTTKIDHQIELFEWLTYTQD
jgi:putative transposase